MPHSPTPPAPDSVRIGRLGLTFYRAGVCFTLYTGAEPSQSGRAYAILDFDQVVEVEGRLLDWLLGSGERQRVDPR